MFFGVPGSGQGALNPAPTTVPRGISPADARAYGSTVARLKDDLVHRAGRALAHTAAVRYPAVSWLNYVGAGGLTGELDTSERIGASRLVSQIRHSYANDCPLRPVLLAGYSQGAEVVIRAVDRLSPLEQRSVTVALLGNPSYQPRRRGDFPGRSAAEGLRPTLGAGPPLLLPRPVLARTIDICAPGDPICNVPPSGGNLIGQMGAVLDHLDVHARAYQDGRYPRAAARFLWRHRVR
ncbi:MAG TPA: cutinase family protein [Jatrophihabitans sp.]|nr:cutinase family protein [Jatrophihabitans sp.]